MNAEQSFKAELREQLVSAAHRQVASSRRVRRHGLLAAAAVAATIALVAAVSIMGRPQPASAGVEIRVVGGRLEIRLTDVETRAGYVQDQIRKAGLDVAVITVPVGPSQLGRFVRVAGDDPPQLRTIDERGASTFVGFSVPVGWNGHLDLALGRAAHAGEGYVAFSDAYAAGEPLACSGLWGKSAVAAVPIAESRHVDIVFEPFVDGLGQPPIAASALAGSGMGGWLVSDAIAVSSNRVLLDITADGRPPTDPPMSPDRGACHR
jgi:hypothetical protein